MPLPQFMYIEILVETGGGCEVQFPVAALPRYFGIGDDDERTLDFHFPLTGETTTKRMNHWDNNTHRVYLNPLRDVERPAVLKILRVGTDRYECEVVPSGDYQSVIDDKCREQTRINSKRWGLE